jgi:predicted flap endonuclease-1-like 5' DNA nuclease
VAAVPVDAAAEDVVGVEAVGAPTTVEPAPAPAEEVEIPAAGSTVEALDDTVETSAPAVVTSLVEPTDQESPAAHAVVDTFVDPAPALEAGVPAPEASDDLRRIEGVGPKMAAALQAAGIRTYRQLAEIDEAALREAVKNAGLRAAPSLPMWPQRAKALVNGATETPVPATTGSSAQGDDTSV